MSHDPAACPALPLASVPSPKDGPGSLCSGDWLGGFPNHLKSNPADAVMTPEWAAKDMVQWFKPTGRILEPCKGFGAILTQLPDHAEWCEITQGKDFFDWHERVDWIISNPPYSGFREWMEHSYEVADNIVYLCPLNKFFNAYGQIEACRKHGWVKHIRNYGTGTKLKFPMGNAIGAMHFVKGYFGDTSWSFFAPPNASDQPTAEKPRRPNQPT